MYWNNCWLNNFNFKCFFNKTLFLENIFVFIFSEKIFKTFFQKKEINIKKIKNEEGLKKKLFKKVFFKKVFLKKINIKNNLRISKLYLNKKKTKKKNKFNIKKYNFSKLWFIKYNNYILLTSFIFFYFKIKSKKKINKRIVFLPKISLIFWKKRRGNNIKKKIFFKNKYIYF